MKKPSTWAGIIGSILIALNLFSLAKLSYQPTSLKLVNIATAATSIAYIALAVFLIWLYLNGRQKEDVAAGEHKAQPDSAEDVRALKRRQEWIFAFLIASEIIGSLGFWILNDYRAGLTVQNMTAIFDVISNVVLAYIMFELFRGARNVSRLILVAMPVYVIGLAILFAARGHWYSAIYNVLFGGFFVVALLVPVTRKSFRGINLILLPVLIVLGLTSVFFDNDQIPDLSRQEGLLEQRFQDDSNKVNADFTNLATKDEQDKVLIEDARDALTKRSADTQNIRDNIQKLQAAYRSQTASIQQAITLEAYNFTLRYLDIDLAQDKKMHEMLDYLDKAGPGKYSEAERRQISAIQKEIDAYGDQFTDLQFEESKANLGTSQ